MSSLADAIAAELQSQVRECRVQTLLGTLPKDLRADLKAALAAKVKAPYISRALTTVGFPLGETTLRRHMAGECTCEQANGRSR